MMLLVLLLIANAVYAQGTSATLTGTITDASQARLTEVKLQLTNEDTGVVRTGAANSEGEFTFPLLIPGPYRLVATAPGFQTLTRTGLVLELGRVSRVDLAMQLGQLSESIEVSSSAPLLESDTSTVGQFIENKTITDMPLNGRRVGDLLNLMGAGMYITGDVIRPRVVIAGGRADQQQWLLDGVNSSNIALENPQALFNPPVESVQEIRIQQNAYSAEFGNSTSGVITMTTKSGTNRLTGSAYEYFRNDKLDARNFFAASRAPLRWNVFGFAAGGPLVIPKLYNGRNRTFFFTSLEWQKQRIGVTRTLTVPTAAQRAGDFSQTLTAAGALIRIYDPNTTRASGNTFLRDPFPGNVVPPARLDPVASRIAALFPSPNRPATNAAGANNFVANAVNALNITTWTSKVDHTFNDRDRVSARFLVHDFPTYATAVFPVAAADPNANVQARRAYSLLLNHIHTFGPALVNDFRFNWQPRRFHFQSTGLGDGWPTQLGLKGVADDAFPRVNATGFTSLGNTNHERIQMPIHDTHIVNAISWFRGRHSFKFGAEARLGRNVDDFNPAISGLLSFAPQATALPGVNNTGNAMASLLLGVPQSGSVRDTDLLDRRSAYYAGFVQDDWRVSTNFTLNLGLRWEAHTPRTDASNRQNGFDVAAINPVSGTPGVVTFAGLDGEPEASYNGDYNNFGPRIGIGWKPFGNRTVIRTGYGLFFGPPQPGSNNSSAGFETSGDFASPDNGITAPFTLSSGFPSTARPELNAGYGAVRVGQPVRFSPDFVDRNRPLGYSQQWNFVIQQEVGWNTVMEASYLANVGHKLNGPNTNINQVPPELMGPGNAQIRRPFPQFANIVLINPMWGNSNYHGMNLKVEKRFSQGLNFLANYTFSKFIDDVGSGQENGQAASGIQNVYNRGDEMALSGNDVRNRFVFSSVYELPLGRGRRWWSQGAPAILLGGWNIGAIVTLQDGSPVGLVTQVNTTNAFNPGAQRVDILRDPSLPEAERNVQRWFDTTAVAAPPQFAFGNAGRTVLTGPGLAKLDLSLLKNFALSERFNVQFRGEAFNAMNRANFEDPGNALGSPNFGVISASRDARSIQLGLKLSF